MKKMSSVEIKNKFLDFFKNKDHMEIEDSSIIPKNDPTLLFINSGMAPIKNYFTGVEKPPYPRLCDVQPCIRTIDIDSIGDKHHLTSFQMLGSWSINDYLKEKAISLAFEFLTESLKIPKNKLYVTVFSGDEEIGLPWDSESYEYWKKVGMPESHIIKCPKEDNFWGPTAETGPCGPCTEIFYDTGEGLEYVPGGEFDTKKRYIEIWNAGVFMQLNKNADGSFSKLSFTSVDTGAGLERLSMVLGGYSTVYDTDLLNPIKKFLESKILKNSSVTEKEILIITDHMRTTALILSENVAPSNEGRGYIPRKLIRRCMMILAKNKIFDFNLVDVIEFILENYVDIFPRFKDNKKYIIAEFKKEHEQFKKVLEKGLERLEHIKEMGNFISGEEAFELVTTYGLPFDIILGYAKDNNMKTDKEGFEKKLSEHKEKSKNISGADSSNSTNVISQLISDCSSTDFVGYERFECKSEILKIIVDKELCSKISEGESAAIVLDRSCFYAQSGGQCADSGYLMNDNCKFKVTDVKKVSEGVFVHFGKVESGTIKSGDIVISKIDVKKRKNTACNHTAVHLLQSALRSLYGKNIHQAGSKVDDKKLRFDFNCDFCMGDEEIFEIEKLVNSYIRENIERKVEIMKLSDAISRGAIALFENKYGENVRVVTYFDISSELCGGTHTERTGNIGLFTILSTEGIGKGMKRITAVTGSEAIEYVQSRILSVNKIAKMLKVKPENILDKLNSQLSAKESVKPKNISLNESDISFVKNSEDIKAGYIVLEQSDKKLINEVDKIANRVSGIIVCVAGTEKKQIIVAVSDSYVRLYPANVILSKIMEKINGKGGGNKKIATGGSKIGINEILTAIEEILKF